MKKIVRLDDYQKKLVNDLPNMTNDELLTYQNNMSTYTTPESEYILCLLNIYYNCNKLNDYILQEYKENWFNDTREVAKIINKMWIMDSAFNHIKENRK